MPTAAGTTAPPLCGLPEGVVLEYARLPVDELPPLLREESRLMAGLPLARREDFRLGRAAAAKCLSVLGQRGPVLSEGRMPLFPQGVVGSISHRNGTAVCLAARSSNIRAAGVDIEIARSIPPRAARILCTERERAWLKQQPDPEQQLTALFSMKEAVYKAACGLRLAIRSFKELELPVDCYDGKVWDGIAVVHGVRLQTGGRPADRTVLTWAVARL